jgi:alpha-D-ribose 1-methylphosphonate 5-triphosphate synthase subunit PhnI
VDNFVDRIKKQRTKTHGEGLVSSGSENKANTKSLIKQGVKNKK